SHDAVGWHSWSEQPPQAALHQGHPWRSGHDRRTCYRWTCYRSRRTVAVITSPEQPRPNTNTRTISRYIWRSGVVSPEGRITGAVVSTAIIRRPSSQIGTAVSVWGGNSPTVAVTPVSWSPITTAIAPVTPAVSTIAAVLRLRFRFAGSFRL